MPNLSWNGQKSTKGYNIRLVALTLIAVALLITFSIEFSYFHPSVRLEHFSFLFVMLGVVINGYFLWALITQVRQGKESLGQARAANEEARRARIDSRSISLVPTVEFESLTFSREDQGSFEIGENVQSYTTPKDDRTRVIFRVFGSIKNEGLVTAQVMTTGNATFDSETVENSEFLWKSGLFSNDDHILLSPGESRKFVWCDGHTVKEWLGAYEHNHTEADFDENSSCKIQFRAWDFQHNVYEYIDIEAQGYPLHPDSQDKGKVNLDATKFGHTVYPVQRLYGDAERAKYTNPYDYRTVKHPR